MRRSSHFADDLVDGCRQLYDAKNAVNRVAGPTAFPEQHAISVQFELHHSTRTETELFANLNWDRYLPLGGNRTLHR